MEKDKLEYERQLASLPPMVAGMIELMRERMYEMEDIMAWTLAQLDHLPGVQPHHALRFLSNRANQLECLDEKLELSLSPEDIQAREQNQERVALLDYLREQVQEWHRLQAPKP